MAEVRRGLLTLLMATLLVAGALEPAFASERQPAVRAGAAPGDVADRPVGSGRKNSVGLIFSSQLRNT